MMYSLALDIVLAVLLVATIGYAMVLNRKLGNLRRHKEELESLAATFSNSTTRAKDSISHLKNSTAELQADTAKAASLRDDLKFLIDRGTSTADRLEAAVRKSRGESDPSSRPVDGKPRQRVETRDEAIVHGQDSTHMDSRVNRGKQAGGPANNEFASVREDSDDNARSQAERELIEALRSVR